MSAKTRLVNSVFRVAEGKEIFCLERCSCKYNILELNHKDFIEDPRLEAIVKKIQM